MRLDVKFRLSVYLSLILASACLGHAEEAFLPGVLIFVTAVSVLFALAFLLEGRWALTALAANVLGVFIASGAALWILSRLLRPPEGFAVPLPWQAMLLPFIGPVLICLVLVKLFRPKQVNDFWLLHTVGLMEVILACVLASEPLFGVLLLAYVIGAVWSLSLFQVYRERLRAGGDVALPAPGRRLAGTVFSSLALAVLALPLFLLTPKLGETAWSPFSLNRTGPAVVAYADSMDLNRVGRLRPTDQEAFKVEARDAGDGPKTDIDLEQRWRGAVLDHYQGGRWFNRDQTATALPRRHRGGRYRFSRILIPRPQRGEYTLAFSVPADCNGLFLADPVSLPDADPGSRFRLAPVAAQSAESRKAWSYEATDFTLHLMVQQSTHHYTQMVAPPAEPGVSPPVPETVATDPQYVQQPVVGVRRHAVELVRRFLAEGRLTASDITLKGEDVSVRPDQWEKVATVFTEYLALSPDFTYSLQLSRRDMTLDPNEDFLRNLRIGHCERFASALALLLRSCGIPSRVVIGFRGAEPLGDGRYVVRQNAAHGWVEVAVPRRQTDGTSEWHWRTFDPTPSDESSDAEARASRHGWPGWQNLGNILWRNFVIDYNAEKRSEAGSEVSRWVSPAAIWQRLTAAAMRLRAEWAALALVLTLCLVVTVRRHRRRRREGTPEPAGPPTFGFPVYKAMLDALQHGLKLAPRPSQTPREFAVAAGAALQSRPDLVAFQDVPRQVVEALYQVVYGKLSLPTEETRELERQVQEVETRLREAPRTT